MKRARADGNPQAGDHDEAEEWCICPEVSKAASTKTELCSTCQRQKVAPIGTLSVISQPRLKEIGRKFVSHQFEVSSDSRRAPCFVCNIPVFQSRAASWKIGADVYADRKMPVELLDRLYAEEKLAIDSEHNKFDMLYMFGELCY